MKKGRISQPYWCWPGVDSAELPIIYSRRQDRLSAHDRADLEAYAEVLRPYYDIPDGEPVFPEQENELQARTAQPCTAQQPAGPKPKPRATGTNRDDHPWRGTL